MIPNRRGHNKVGGTPSSRNWLPDKEQLHASEMTDADDSSQEMEFEEEETEEEDGLCIEAVKRVCIGVGCGSGLTSGVISAWVVQNFWVGWVIGIAVGVISVWVVLKKLG